MNSTIKIAIKIPIRRYMYQAGVPTKNVPCTSSAIPGHVRPSIVQKPTGVPTAGRKKPTVRQRDDVQKADRGPTPCTHLYRRVGRQAGRLAGLACSSCQCTHVLGIAGVRLYACLAWRRHGAWRMLMSTRAPPARRRPACTARKMPCRPPARQAWHHR